MMLSFLAFVWLSHTGAMPGSVLILLAIKIQIGKWSRLGFFM